MVTRENDPPEEQFVNQPRLRQKKSSSDKAHTTKRHSPRQKPTKNGEVAGGHNGHVSQDSDFTSDSESSSVEGSPSTVKINPPSIPTSDSSLPAKSWKPYILSSVVILVLLLFFLLNPSDQSQINVNWRKSVDPEHVLSVEQRATVLASLKPILHKLANEEQEGVSTLLILSPNEQIAAQLARCLLDLVNTKKHPHGLSAEIDLGSHHTGNKALDTHLRSLLSPDGITRGVLLRHIDHVSFSSDAAALEQIRLLFAYCDDENPVIPHRLIIMTATSDRNDGNDLRHNFKRRWPREHDFVDALMSRISGHVLHVPEDQRSIC